MTYEPVIGLEIHVQLRTKTKMFCDSKNDPDEKHPNVNICEVCAGQPGTLPTINLEAIKKTILLGMAFDCHIAEHTFFERKNYFYPDLPKGYQISQYQAPLCSDGYFEILAFASSAVKNFQFPISNFQSNPNDQNLKRRIRIRRIHIEEDTGRLLHDPKGKYSLVDFNRAGVPLLELVTEPDLRSGEEVREFGEELQLILRYLGVSDADMQKGQMRVEVNISLRKIRNPKSEIRNEELGSKVELKNINSFRFAEQAVNYEIKRQSELLSEGKKVIQETRGWDEAKQKTFSQRTKEEAQDYRYFPEPDLPPLFLSSKSEELQRRAPRPFRRDNKEFMDTKAVRRDSRTTNESKTEFEPEWGGVAAIDLDSIRVQLVELPQQRRERFKKLYNLPERDIEILTFNKKLGDYYENVASELDIWAKLKHKGMSDAGIGKEPHMPVRLHSLAANYLITELAKLLNERGTGLEEMEHIKITPENFAEFVVKIFHNEISSSAAQIVLKEMFETGEDPSDIIEKKDLAQVSDVSELELAAKEVIAENPKPVEDYKKGKKESLQFLVGQMMKKTKGKANPQVAKEVLEKELGV